MQKLLLLVLAALTLSACNTVKGVGQDVSKGGQAIENAAKDVSNKM
ncbi:MULTISPECIES: entericidin A/B family lipoprotein [Chromobacterium]|jgi:predicted small secreted protein|uniref:Entericidin n=3 Tax=Chromobacterium TaxID=535 RepID=A0A1W0CZJ7_9NEIS|nr:MULTISPECIES: entericidin A/B family lipoprotein [Chromobacterium]RBH36294.1 entericidin, EcnA/B family [Pseudomonas sp. MWU13-2860]AXT46126.1 entericidin, EcnA/B family [Chromobacterium rhizoryzae]MBK0413496.1 entericidin A/B family lipoprotein [Chromobacterium haemolyticum]MBN3005737.1 entericidin A/B family lipoprotein [Chromobacterium alkanivorans]MBO0414598.1 entericidin A/B family lipoprotein [Chromobacterium haemolyticum]